ncbi:hypothetical protein [Rhodoferax sp.]|uniref:hypothetical protein n=1 Tax=Rhodoferax sp. TaxID=50421 RepID=UPI002754F65B|nr:hypothetical protein [Rhodoferax sp.]
MDFGKRLAALRNQALHRDFNSQPLDFLIGDACQFHVVLRKFSMKHGCLMR